MSKQQHTQGPWKAIKGTKEWRIKTKDGCILACVHVFPEGAMLAKDGDGNARLIAAAPALLDACKKARTELAARIDYEQEKADQGDINALHAVSKAITQAEGEA